MATIVPVHKAASTNPLKSSAPLGAAMAYLGVEGAVPLFHGSQGCTAFALVLLVRHFKETIPIQTTAMDEVATILGGADHLEEAILNLRNRMKPKLIGVATTALVETRGEDFASDIALIRERRAEELGDTEIVLASTPDFEGSLEEGWAAAVTALIEALVPAKRPHVRELRRVNILAGLHLTVADIEWLRDTAESFGLEPVILPDISGSLDGTVPDQWVPTSYGGTSLADIHAMGRAVATIAIGEHMRGPADALAARTGAPVTFLPTATGLKAADRLVWLLSEISGRPVPQRLKRKRAQLVDAMLDGHFFFAGKRVAVAGEPDLLFTFASLFAGLGAEIVAAVAATGSSPVLARVPAETVMVGDLGDLEALAEEGEADLIACHAHGRQAAERLGVPHLRIGFPIFDRIGAQHRLTVGHEGTMRLIFEIANLFQAGEHAHTPAALDPFRDREDTHDRRSTPVARQPH